MKGLCAFSGIALVGIFLGVIFLFPISAYAGESSSLPARLSNELASAPGAQVLYICQAEGGGTGGTAYTATLYEKSGDEWTPIMTMPAVVGKNGIAAPNKKVEGDLKTPSGMFPLGTGFGTVKPAGTSMCWKNAGQYDYWVDDPESPDYNTWQVEKGDPKKRWKSAEKLAIASYQYAIVVEYNTSPVVKNKGSAIFIHIWKDSKTATAGCVAVARENVIALLRRVDPSKKPVIIIRAPE